MRPTIYVDYDNTLHDTDSKYEAKLDGLLNIDGATLWDLFINKVHRDEIHRCHLEKHDDLRFHIILLLKKLGYDDKPETIAEVEAAFVEAERECVENPAYFPDAFDFLKRIKEEGYCICLATGPDAIKKAEAVERVMAQKIFDYVFGEDTLQCIKSEPAYYQRALKAANATPSLSAIVGDTIMIDVAPAKKVGLTTIWLNRTGRHLTKDGVIPDYQVKSLHEALDTLKTIF